MADVQRKHANSAGRPKFNWLDGMKFRPPMLTVLAVAVLLISMVGALLYRADVVKAQEELLTASMARNDLRAKQLAGSVGQMTAAIIRLFDMALLQLRDVVVEDGAGIQDVVALIQKNLPAGSVNLVLVVAANGQVAYSSGPGGQGTFLGDRPYFRFFAENPQDQLFITPPIETRMGDHRWAIPLARPIRKDGRFLGVVVIGLRPEYLSERFSELSLNPGDVVALVLNDGTFLSRNHSLAGALGRKAPADRPFLDPSRSDDETSRSVSSVDNIPVNFAWKHLRDWPLISVVALDERAELGPIGGAVESARRRTNITVAVIFVFSLVVSCLLLWAQRQRELLVNTGSLLRSIMDSLPHSIAVVDQKGLIIQVNQSWSEFARENGAVPAVVDGIGLDYFDMCRADAGDQLAEEALAGMQAVLSGRQDRFTQEYPCHSPTRPHWFEFRVTPLLGSRQGLVTSHVEITERKLAQQRLEQLLAELEQFAYVASHDLRQPLRMVTSYLGIIEKKLGLRLDDDLRKYLGFAIDGAKRMDHLIVALLEYSRTGKSAEILPVSLGNAAADAIANLTVAVREANAGVSVADRMPTILGDSTEITRLFQNLIANAVKYRSPDRPPLVDIGWSRQSNTYLVRVKDNGMGIAEEHCERAFQIFQRLVPKDAYEGSGIGLAVCKKIVEHHGGKIWIESEVGVGSTFFMTFPVPSRAESEQPA